METLRRSERLKKKRDRLSDLPNEILLHIMSFMMIQDAIQTCILSKRWKNLWKALPSLTLHSHDFKTCTFFFKFVDKLVKYRNGNHPLRTLDFNRQGYFPPLILNNLLQHAVFNNLQQLKIAVPYNLSFPDSIFSCPSLRSLTSLHISQVPYGVEKRTKVPMYVDLPALVNLHLEWTGISADKNGHAYPFSNCHMLKTLYIENCPLFYPSSLSPNKLGIINITNASLAHLTIFDVSSTPKFKYVISAPNLSSFTLNGSPFKTWHGHEDLMVELHSSSLV